MFYFHISTTTHPSKKFSIVPPYLRFLLFSILNNILITISISIILIILIVFLCIRNQLYKICKLWNSRSLGCLGQYIYMTSMAILIVLVLSAISYGSYMYYLYYLSTHPKIRIPVGHYPFCHTRRIRWSVSTLVSSTQHQ